MNGARPRTGGVRLLGVTPTVDVFEDVEADHAERVEHPQARGDAVVVELHRHGIGDRTRGTPQHTRLGTHTRVATGLVDELQPVVRAAV